LRKQTPDQVRCRPHLGKMAHLAGLEETRLKAIQVDGGWGGSEFIAEFEEACELLGIELFALPRSLNGLAPLEYLAMMQEESVP